MKTKNTKSTESYYNQQDNYKEPWQTQDGFWIVSRQGSTTSYKRIDNPDYIEVRAALIKYYDIVVDRMLKYDQKKEGYYSISDIVLDSVACLTEIINSQNKT